VVVKVMIADVIRINVLSAADAKSINLVLVIK